MHPAGKSCAAPFDYMGKSAWGCVRVGSKLEFCTTVDGKWEQCAARVTNISRYAVCCQDMMPSLFRYCRMWMYTKRKSWHLEFVKLLSQDKHFAEGMEAVRLASSSTQHCFCLAE